MANASLCEHVRPKDLKVCGTPALWRVSRLYRNSDAQDSCSRHLSATVTALLQWDEGANAVIKVTRVEVPRG